MTDIDEQIRTCRESIKKSIDRELASFNNPVKEDINTYISKIEKKLEETKTDYALLEKQYGYEDSQNSPDKDIEDSYYKLRAERLKSKLNKYTNLLKIAEDLRQNPHTHPYALPKIATVSQSDIEMLSKIFDKALEYLKT